MAQSTPDPKRPYKAYASAVVAFLGALVASGQDILPAWVVLVCTAVIAGLVTFTVPNPE